MVWPGTRLSITLLWTGWETSSNEVCSLPLGNVLSFLETFVPQLHQIVLSQSQWCCSLGTSLDIAVALLCEWSFLCVIFPGNNMCIYSCDYQWQSKRLLWTMVFLSDMKQQIPTNTILNTHCIPFYTLPIIWTFTSWSHQSTLSSYMLLCWLKWRKSSASPLTLEEQLHEARAADVLRLCPEALPTEAILDNEDIGPSL